MKEQSAVEFLTIYGFMFVIIGVTITIIAFVAYTTNGYIPQQCSGLTGLDCQFVIFYSNSLQANAIITMRMTNSQSVPINISNISVSVKNYTFNGTCAPQFINPGGWTVCSIQGPYTTTLGTQIQGSYIIRAHYCNSPISHLNQTACSFEKVSYVGTFSTTASKLSTTTTSTTSTSSTSSTTSTSTTSTSTSTTSIPQYVYCIAGATSSTSMTASTYYSGVSSTGTGTWSSTTSYPLSISSHSCAIFNGYVYCVMGTGTSSIYSNVYYAPISSTGIGTWAAGTSYPFALYDGSCNAAYSHIYCVGGTDGGGSYGNVYYAPVSSTGVGTWASTTSYPVGRDGIRCVISSGYIYCTGGEDTGFQHNNSYYAPISSTGVGAWSTTANYPVPSGIQDQNCLSYSGDIYCIAGAGGQLGAVLNNSYYATAGSSGIGTWTATTSYPLAVSTSSCYLENGIVYCVGGSTGYNLETATAYYAPLSGTGIGNWTATTNYPTATYSMSCVGT